MESMQQADRGTKRICVECAARFFDLGRTPIHCPKCDAIFVPPEPAPPRAPRPPRRQLNKWPPHAAAEQPTVDKDVDDDGDETEETEETEESEAGTENGVAIVDDDPLPDSWEEPEIATIPEEDPSH